MELEQIKSVFFVGIGGIGMSALARYFEANHFFVAGYDRTSTKLTNELVDEGIDILFEDDVNCIPKQCKSKETTLVVYTPAISSDHKLLNFFIDEGFIVKKRAAVLGMLTARQKGVCVAGTHGKTTISTMLSHLLKQSKVDCSAFLGGVSQNYKTNLLLSSVSDYVVLEADEFDRSFLHLTPYLALISSADADHLDIYGNDTSVKESFQKFASLVKEGGVLLTKKEIDLDFPQKKGIVYYTYSLSDTSAHFYAENLRLKNGLYIFDLITPEERLCDLYLGIPGLVNVENAVGACAAAWMLGARYDELKKALPDFCGIRRRFDYRIKTNDLVLIDDYAHHPEEINATIKSVRALYPNKKLTGVFQPHLYSRTNDFYKDFAASLTQLDEVLMLDIYPAREEPMEGVSSKMILDLIDLPVKSLCKKEELLGRIKSLKPEVLLMMGAGDIDKEIDYVVENLI
jgi:UDP-N-acetylmuramate--alanine ligase